MKFLLVGFVILILIVLGASLFWWQENLKPANPVNNKTISFTVKQGESLKKISQRLEEEKIIRNKLAFSLLARKLGLQNKIQAGEFALSPSFDSAEIIQDMTHGTADVWVTIPEGLRNEEIARILFEKLNIPEKEFLKIARIGHMFPDTYLFPKTTTAEMAAETMSDNFDAKMENLDGTIFQPDKKFNELNLDEIVTIASIVEREARFEKDRPIIAGILIKRIQQGWPLEVDATLQYVLGYDDAQKTWWRNNLTAEELKLDSHYNTRKYNDLPPTPISNPGIAVISGVLHPTFTDYWFYLSDHNGQMHYAKTLEEHNGNIKKYLE